MIRDKEEFLRKALQDVKDEVLRATSIHGTFNSSHEGFAVLLEEVDELWDEVKSNNAIQAYAEAVQVAAMAIRFIMDISYDKEAIQ